MDINVFVVKIRLKKTKIIYMMIHVKIFQLKKLEKELQIMKNIPFVKLLIKLEQLHLMMQFMALLNTKIPY